MVLFHMLKDLYGLGHVLWCFHRRVRQSIVSVARRSVHENGAGGAADNLVGDAAQEHPPHAAASMRRQSDEITASRLRFLQDGGGGMRSDDYARLHRHTLVAQSSGDVLQVLPR